MNLLQVVPTYVPAYRHGGPVRAVHGLARALLARGHRVTVFTTDLDGPGRLAVPRAQPVAVDGVEVWYFPARAPRRLHRAPALGPALARQSGRFDAAHLHSLFLQPVWAAAARCRAAALPYVVSPRGMLTRELVERRGRLRKGLALALFDRRVLAGAALLHATSELEAEQARRFGLPLPPITVIPNGVEAEPEPDPAAVAPELAALAAAGPFLLFLGRVSWKKGLDRLISALPHVPAVPLLVAGPDDEGLTPRLLTLARQAGVADRVRFAGSVDGADRAFLLHRAALAVLPSYGENFGNAVVEALAVGCPVVVTRQVGAAEVVERCGGGVVVDGAPESLGAALAELLVDPERRREQGEAGRRYAARELSWDAVAGRFEALYERIAAA
jgi:glycosyltransferase involved in cell wall biosynthesis